MSEYFFGLGSGKVRRKTAKKINKIAGKHDACIVCYDDPARGPRYWMACPNRGSPFDKATEEAVLADLEKAGLWPVPVKKRNPGWRC